MKNKLWNKDYVLLLQGHAVSTIGDLMYSVAICYWVYEKTGSTGLMGIMSAVSMFVTMFLSPFAGSVVDKCNRKWVIVGMDALQGILMLCIGALAFADSLSIPVVLISAVVAAFCGVLYSPAVSTLMIDIIPHDEMVRGQSIYSGSKMLINLVSSAFSGAMVAFFGVPLIIVINGISNLYSAITELFVYVPKTLQQGQQVTVGNLLSDMKTALHEIFSDRFMKLFIPSLLILNLCAAGPISLLLPFCLEKGFTVGMYGYITAIYMIASLVCTLLLGAVKLKPMMRYVCMAAGFLCYIPFSILAFLSNHFAAVCVFASLASFANAAGNTVFNASMMLALPDENRGAILGFVDAASVGGCAVSTMCYGFLGDLFPLYLVFTVGSVITLAPMLVLCVSRRTKDFMLSH